jgi:hypothetical protein
MMDTAPLLFQHRDLLNQRFSQVHTFLSEYSFANLYLFRQAHDHRVITCGEEVFVSGRTYDGAHYVMPTRDVAAADIPLLSSVAAGHDVVFPVPEEWLGAFNDASATFVDGDSDYIYTVEKMATFRGQKLHSKKNLLNQFLSLYTPRPRPLTRDLMADALHILEAWQEDVGGDRADTDYGPCREAFELYDELVLCGGIYYVGDEPAGFIIGEEINGRMFALHFAKGKRKFKGMYQYMFNHFAGILPAKYEFLNFEQDMGKLALRIAKSSYHPDRILKKFRITLPPNL